ncbi:MAG: hypothetical protein LBU11_03250 [Zoogloeaceae bacterium]|jgi:hypothetical protein|nr:hypothetical protein [Zoogloeaceae bacterium]
MNKSHAMTTTMMVCRNPERPLSLQGMRLFFLFIPLLFCLTAQAETNEPPCEVLQEGKWLVCERLLTNFVLEYEACVFNENTGECEHGCKLSIFDKRTPGRKLVQQIDNIVQLERVPYFYRIDINFDGHEDIGYITDCGYQCGNAFLLYDPEKGLFFDSGFDEGAMFGTMEVDEDAKIISIGSAHGNPGEFSISIYAVENNRLRLLERYDHGEAWTDEDFFRKKTKDFVENLVLDKTFSSVGLERNFTLDVHADLRGEGE